MNSVLNRGAILGFVMLCSHVFEQCAVVYGGTMAWFSVMGAEIVASCALYCWMLYRFAKEFSLSVMEKQQIKMFSYGAALNYTLSVSMLGGVIVGLGRYILHSFVIGHQRYVESMVTSLQTALNSNPQTASMMDSYKQLFAQIASQPEPGIFSTLFSTMWNYVLFGFFVGLVVAAFVKREPQLFDKSSEE